MFGIEAEMQLLSPRFVVQLPCEELLKLRQYFVRKIIRLGLSFESQVVASAFDNQKFSLSGDQFARSIDLFDCAERIAGSFDEQRGNMELRKMFGSQALRFSGRMQRIRKQKQAVREFFFREQDAGLTAPVALTTKKDLSRTDFLHRKHGVLQSSAIVCCVAWAWRPELSILAKGQVATKNGVPGFRKRFGHRDQHGHLRISASAVGDY